MACVLLLLPVFSDVVECFAPSSIPALAHRQNCLHGSNTVRSLSRTVVAQQSRKSPDGPERGKIFGFLEDVADYLDEKGGYIITEEQLKGRADGSLSSGLGDDDLDLQGIQEAFDRPKAKPVDVNINLFLGFILIGPIILWLQWIWLTNGAMPGLVSSGSSIQ